MAFGPVGSPSAIQSNDAGILNLINSATGQSAYQGGVFPAAVSPYGSAPSDNNLNTSITTTSGTADDPYAKYGGTAAYNALVSGFGAQKTNIINTAGEAASNAGKNLGSSITDFINNLRDSQKAIDNKGVQNELSKIQGGRSILDMVGRGIKSGGVMLAGRNAGNSSGAEAIAHAYGDLGRREMSKVGNQYELGNFDINQQQGALDQKRDQYVNGDYGYKLSKENVVSGIVTDARGKLAALDAAMASASLPDRIAIEQEKESIRQQVLGQLSQYDQQLASQNGTVSAMGQDARRNQAFNLSSAGVAPEHQFDFATQAPAQLQGTGPFASDLPIFTYGQKRQLA